MDFISPEQMAVNGAASLLLMGGFKLFSKIRRKKKVLGLCIPVGKTTLCKMIADPKHYFIDADEFCELNDKAAYDRLKTNPVQFILHYFPKLDNYINQLARSFGNKTLVVVSSNKELLEQLGIKVRTYCPSERHIQNMPLDEKQKNTLMLKCVRLASTCDKYRVFDSFQQLHDLIRTKFDVRNVL